MTACCYCRGPGATFPVNSHAFAHQACAYAADDEDQRAMFQAMAIPTAAPEELEVEYLATAERLPPRRADEPRCAEDGCSNPARRAGLCWFHVKQAQRERLAGRSAA